MLKRGLLIGGATAVAAVVLLVTLLAGPPATPPRSTESTPPGQVKLPTGSGAPMGDPSHAMPVLGSTQGRYEFQHDDRVTRLHYAEITPLPDGVIEVVEPLARTHLAPGRVMEMTADDATFVAPDNQPRRGDFRGNVILTLYETADGSPVDLSSRRDVRMIVYLDEATFDLELGQVDSTGPVHLTGATVDFHGTGLSLNYNQLRQRLERLEIFEGESLRFRPSDRGEPVADADEPEAAAAFEPVAEAPSGDDPAAASVSDRSAAEAASGVAAGEASETDSAATPVASADAPSDATPEPPVQYYRARFDENVVVNAPGEADDVSDDVTMTADTLIALFSMDMPADEDAQAEDAETGEAEAEKPAERGRQARTETPAETGSAGGPSGTTRDEAGSAPPMGRSLMAHSDEDIIITWTGPLLVEPQAERPADLVDADDVLLGLQGELVHIRTGRDQTLIAQEVDYLTSSGRIRAKAAANESVVLTASDLGIISGSALLIDQAAGTGYVLGPGWIQGQTASRETDDPQPAGEFEITWLDRLDLTFYPSHGARSSRLSRRDTSGGLQAIQTAVFYGDAVANHPQFHLRGNELAITFTEPDDQAPQTLDRIDATGRVMLAARSGEQDEPIDIVSDDLTIDMDTDEAGELRPTRIIANGNVKVTEPTFRLRAQHLDVTPAPAAAPADASASVSAPEGAADTMAQAAPAEAGSAGEEPAPAAPRLAVSHMLATDDVEVELTEHGLTLYGQRLVVDSLADQIDLFGSETAPARVVQPDGTLTGGHIIVGQVSETVHVAGPGTLDMAALPQSGSEGESQGGPLRVTWQTAMHFDNRHGQAEFVDQIIATTQSPTDRTRLTADHLHLELEPAPSAPEAEASTGAEASAESNADADADAVTSPTEGTDENQTTPPARRLRTATARGNAIFTARTYDESAAEDEAAPLAPATEFRLEGPVMTFDNRGEVEQIQVLGAGRMLNIDRRRRHEHATAHDPIRNADATAESRDTGASPASAAQISGRGDTLFLWTETLTLDAARNTMTMVGNVEMIHRPQPEPAPAEPASAGVPPAPAAPSLPIRFYAQHLLVDLEDAGGMGGWMDDEAPQPEITEIHAHQGVIITRGPRRVTADHLDYTAADQTVVLTADPGAVVQVTEEGQPTPITGRVITWNLDRNLFRVTEPAPTIIPMRR